MTVPDEVTIVRVGHPLCGQKLRVEPSAGLSRKDQRIQVVLPDGAVALVPIAWTDLGAPAATDASSIMGPRFSIVGLRLFVRLVDAIASRAHDAEPPCST